MLEVLRIQNYALIDEIELEFAPGFNVLTGETGAGKSIIVGALNLILGARASSGAVREGAKRAEAEAVFRVPEPSPRLQRILEERELELDDEALVLARRVSSDGRSRAYACGGLVPASVLAEIGDELVDLHGQHEHQSLLQVDRQLELLDIYAGTETAAAEVARGVGELHQLDRRIAEFEASGREQARRLEFLRYEVNEIDDAALELGEEERLQARRNRVANAERIHAAAAAAYTALYEDEGTSASDAIGRAVRELEAVAEVDPEIQQAVHQLNDIRASLDETAQDVRRLSESIEFDPQELDELNQRWDLIRGLKRKYGDTIDAILAYRDEAAATISRFENRDAELEALHAKRAETHARLMKQAGALSKARRQAARKLNKAVTQTLQDLGMAGARFETVLEQSDLTAKGLDKAEFKLAANKGERLKALRQVASGGEISRIMLALKAVFAHADRIPTLIFDEIDAGVGGAVANRVAAKLVQLAESHQTICITHLPQIAAAASRHYHVAKTTRKDRTLTDVSRVEAEERVREIARLLDGSLSGVSLEHARALLEGGSEAQRSA